MTLHASVAGALAAAFRSECAGVQALFECLTKERELLAAGEIDSLAQVATRKRELLLHIAQVGDYRKRLLQQAGVKPDRDGVHALLESAPQMREARAEWDALLDISRKAHRLNQENGAFIEAGMCMNQQALSVLMSAVSTATYGPGGRTLNPLSPRSLTSA